MSPRRCARPHQHRRHGRGRCNREQRGAADLRRSRAVNKTLQTPLTHTTQRSPHPHNRWTLRYYLSGVCRIRATPRGFSSSPRGDASLFISVGHRPANPLEDVPTPRSNETGDEGSHQGPRARVSGAPFVTFFAAWFPGRGNVQLTNQAHGGDVTPRPCAPRVRRSQAARPRPST